MPRGYSTRGDIVEQTIDGRPLDEVWNEFSQTLDLLNQSRSAFTALLCYPTTASAEAIPQTTSRDDFEEASEFGIPKSLRTNPDVLIMGFDFRDYDSRSAYTWKFLRDAPASQVQATHNLQLEADNRLTTGMVLRRLLDNTHWENEENNTVYGLYSGDGIVPPEFGGRTFDGNHTHYLTTQGALEAVDLEDTIAKVTEHGYGTAQGTRILVFAHPDQMRAIRRFRANQTAADGGVSSFDFIPSSNAPAYLTNEQIVGERAPGEYLNLPIAGSYGPAWVIEMPSLPTGYVPVVATGGVNSQFNAVGFREHKTPTYRGLRLIPGPREGYPLVDSFYSRSFGVGIAHRGAAAVIQVTNSANYTRPAL
ncbi:hypothetical protein AB0M83_02410 [Amycolatopsis sp. NPDC051106]|uniref:hypothetical protein n=1 Tax=unclassified Amycolatopsis TaxID=2618356 RepID=UPI00342DB19E